MTHFTNDGGDKLRVAFASPFPGSIIAVNMAGIGNEITCQKESFLCAALATKIDIAFNRKLGAGFLVGRGSFFNIYRVMGWHLITLAAL